MKEALWYEKLDDGKAHCLLCPHECRIDAGARGICRVRENRDGVLYATTYECASSVAMDPIEKKPLYHFYPGKEILSLGSLGCNFHCKFCQNWHISQNEIPTRTLKIDEAVKMCVEGNSLGIAYTYNEPLVGFEYVMETARAVKEEGLRNVVVTNGFINPAPLADLLPYVDALNIDIKSIRDDFYKKICGGSLKEVLATAVKAKKSAHVEITNLVIPGYNDTEEEFAELAAWIASNLGPETPVHLTAYSPRYELNAEPTPLATLERAYDIFCGELYFVYLGNIDSAVGRDTRCMNCGEMLVRRQGYFVEVLGVDREGMCNQCQGRSFIVT